MLNSQIGGADTEQSSSECSVLSCGLGTWADVGGQQRIASAARIVVCGLDIIGTEVFFLIPRTFQRSWDLSRCSMHPKVRSYELRPRHHPGPGVRADKPRLNQHGRGGAWVRFLNCRWWSWSWHKLLHSYTEEKALQHGMRRSHKKVQGFRLRQPGCARTRPPVHVQRHDNKVILISPRHVHIVHIVPNTDVLEGTCY